MVSIFLFEQRGVPQAGVYVAALSNPTPTFVIAADSGAILNRDHLLFVRGKDLLAIAFEPRSLATTGDPRVVLTGVARFGDSSNGFTVAESGAIAAIVGSTNSRRLSWFTLAGERTGSVPGSEGYGNPELTPDGSRLAAERADQQDRYTNLWLLDLERGIGSQVTEASDNHWNPTWSPDGTRLAFNIGSTNAAVIIDLATQHLSALDPPGGEAIVGSWVRDWAPDGGSVLVQRQNAQGNSDLWLVPVDGSTARPLANTAAIEFDGQFSPDGRWVAYTSNRSGRWEAYLYSTGSSRTPIPVSDNGGSEPRWRRDGRVIFYIALDNTLMAVDVIDPLRPLLGVPRRLFKLPIEAMSSARNHFEVAPDGTRVLVVEEIPTNDPLAISVLTNWRQAP